MPLAYPSLFDPAAAYGVSIVGNHPFIDGNKRLALAVMYVRTYRKYVFHL